jgi:hypothetical protein
MSSEPPKCVVLSAERAALLARSCVIPTGIVLFHLADLLFLAWFDPWFFVLWKLEDAPDPVRMVQHVGIPIWGVLTAAWMIVAIEAWRHRGTHRTAAVSFGILIFAVALAGAIHWALVGYWLVGVGR